MRRIRVRCKKCRDEFLTSSTILLVGIHWSREGYYHWIPCGGELERVKHGRKRIQKITAKQGT